MNPGKFWSLLRGRREEVQHLPDDLIVLVIANPQRWRRRLPLPFVRRSDFDVSMLSLDDLKLLDELAQLHYDTAMNLPLWAKSSLVPKVKGRRSRWWVFVFFSSSVMLRST